MEQILSKNIFQNKDLHKLSPDYNPTDIVFKMEMRRNQIKETHFHSKDCNVGLVQRKKIQKNLPKNSIKINKELLKLKETFAKDNLRNEILMKEINTKSSTNINIKKPQRPKTRLRARVFETVEPTSINLDELSYDTANFDEIITEIEDRNVKDDTGLTDRSERACNENSKSPVEDLQSLLIMMAITSNDTADDIKDEEAADIQTIPSNDTLVIYPHISVEGVESVEGGSFLNITSIKSESMKRQEFLATKYTNKWRSYVQKRKNKMAELRQTAINNFFEKLERKKSDNHDNVTNKAKLSIRDYTYQHRYKMQKHIIALQKAKLDEQNRVIEELKYNKIIEASKQSVDAMKDEVRKTYFEMDRNLKPKIKSLTKELNMPEIEEPSLILHCLKVPQFLQRMEKRAREREEKHALIRERRRQMEEERVRLKQQAELAKLEMDKEEKIKRMKELRERRKKEKIENIRKKQRVERMRALKVMVDLHYERNLILRCGLRPWLKLIEMKRDNMVRAKIHYSFQLKKNVFLHWMWHTEDMWFDRHYRADDFYGKKLLQKGFNALKMNHRAYAIKKQIADDYYYIYLENWAYKKLVAGIAIVRQEYEMKLVNAEAYYNCNLIFKTFTLWRTLPALNNLKREQDARKLKWRQKVLQVVPDYTPPDD